MISRRPLTKKEAADMGRRAEKLAADLRRVYGREPWFADAGVFATTRCAGCSETGVRVIRRPDGKGGGPPPGRRKVIRGIEVEVADFAARFSS